MAVISQGPCQLDGWTPDETCLKLPADITEEQRALYQRYAADILYHRTGQRFGPSCGVEVRPCYGGCDGRDGDGWWFSGPVPLGYAGAFYPYRGADGDIRNWRGCGCGDRCHCGPELCKIQLPGPIYDITLVEIDGVEIDKACFFSYDARFLVLNPVAFEARHPELHAKYDGCWPRCQDFTKTGGEGTWSITYSTGLPVPFLAAAAVTELMNHFAGMCSGCGCGTEARQNLTRLSRQGVDLEFADPQQVFTDGRIGLPICDLFVETYNPNKLPRAMRVLSPDVGHAGGPGRPFIQLGY